MKPILAGLAALALSGAPAFASDVGSCAADETEVQAEVIPNGPTIAVATFAGGDAVAPVGPPPRVLAAAEARYAQASYPACRTRAQDRCRIPGQGMALASARAAKGSARLG